MIKEVTMYACICDVCGKQWSNWDGIVAFTDKDDVRCAAEDSEWQIEDGKHLCPDCWEWSEDGEQIVPKKLNTQ
jgi:hypothetical protein